MRPPQTVSPESSIPCPGCGQMGRAVSALTIESLLTPLARARLANTGGFRFCSTADCPVVYHQPASGLRLDANAVRVPVVQKSASSERPVCYCFHHTVGEIEAQVRATGSSTVPAAIKAQCARGLDQCERNNPQGSCCLGNVTRVLKEAQVRHAPLAAIAPSGESAGHDCCREDVPSPQSQRGRWAAVGAMGAAVLSSACCWLPLLLLAFGASAAGVAGFFEQHRPLLLGATVTLLGLGLYSVYFREANCAPGSACAVPNPRLQRANRLLLWLAAVFTLGFALFPNYAGWLTRRGEIPVSVQAGDSAATVFRIEGMTCAACAAGLEARLRSLPGISGVFVDYAKGQARIGIALGADSGSVIESVRQTAGAEGYRMEIVP